MEYIEKYIEIEDNKIFTKEQKYNFDIKEIEDENIGVMFVGWGGNNGSTITSGLVAHLLQTEWTNKYGKQKVEFLGSLSQYGSVHIGYDRKGKPYSKLFKDIVSLYSPDKILIGGWDICSDNIYEASKKNHVLDHELIEEIKDFTSLYSPLPSIYYPDFLASNQSTRANNIHKNKNKWEDVLQIKKDIEDFKKNNNLNKVIIVWTASTERFNKGKWKNHTELIKAIKENDPEVSPSIIFAVASIISGSIFLNGSPQNTLCKSVIDLAKEYKTFVGGEDFKTGQTKIKSVLIDFLTSSGIRPLSIVSYNHLGNNDGKNLDEYSQFRSKEITKKNVIDDVVEENSDLFINGSPDHTIVIKYIPAVGDSKRAMDEYYSELFLSGRHTLALHNTCEDSLLACPVILDIILFSELFSRIKIIKCTGNICEKVNFSSVLSMLSFFFKAPIVNENEPLINSFFKQRYGLENFFRILIGLPPLSHLNLHNKC